MEVIKGMGGEGGKREEESEIAEVMPAARMWEPYSWVEFGLPLMFGHMLGRGVLGFLWVRRLSGY